MPSKKIKTSFNAGEMSELLSAREDHQKYYNGCSVLENATPLPYGGAVRRSGTEKIVTAKGNHRLLPFKFSVNDNMLIEAGNLYMRFLKDDVYETITKASVSNWVAGTDYSVNDIVEDNAGSGLYFYCVSGHEADGAAFSADAGTTGTHDGGDNAATLTDSGEEWTINEFVGKTIVNIDDGSVGIITANTATTITANMHGGTDNDWDDGDEFYISDDKWCALTSYDTDNLIYEIYQPYSDTEIFEVQFKQSGDVLYFAHEDHYPQKLTRVADNSWTMTDAPFTGGPFLDENTDDDYVMTLELDYSGTSGTGSKYAGEATASASLSTTVLVDAGQTWVVDELIGYYIWKPDDDEWQVITDNDATTITTAAFGSTWELNHKYIIMDEFNRLIAGTVGTLTASGTGNTPFVATHENGLWKLLVARDDNVTSTENEAVLIKGDFTVEVASVTATNYIDLQRKEGNKDWQSYRRFNSAAIYSGTEEIDNVSYRFVIGAGSPTCTITAKNQDMVGVVKVTDHTSSTVVTVEVVQNVFVRDDDLATSALVLDTKVWAEGAWSDYRGYPKAIGFYENRLFFGGSTYKPQTLWSSKSGDYEDFESGALDDDAIVFTLSPTGGGDVSNIQWISAREIMFVGTASTEFRLSASNSSDPMTPTDVKAVDKSYFGSDDLQPVLLNNALFFAQSNGRKLRAIRFDLEVEQYTADDATMFNSEIFEHAPVCMDIQNVPDSILWVVRDDGQIACFTYEPKEDVAAWSRLITKTNSYTIPSSFTSVAITKGTVEDNVYVSVERIINGSTVYYIEKFSTRLYDQMDESLMLDCAKVATSGESSQTILAAADTVRFGEGEFGSGFFGGVAP